MNVLFVEKKLRIEKIGMYYIARTLKDAGHTVEIIQDDIHNTHTYLKRNKVDFLFYSVMTGDHEWYIQKNQELKRQFPNIISVMGGPYFTFAPESGLVDLSIDYVVQGPCEEIINDVVDGSIPTKLVRGHIPDLNALPHPYRNFLYDRYDDFGDSPLKRFITGRDCPYACKYCFNHLYHKLFKDQKGRFFQRKAPELMVDEILDVKNNYRLESLYFNDDDFAGDHDWLYEFCELYNHKVHLPFHCGCRANNLTAELIKGMAQAGLASLHVSVESAVPATQKLLRRGPINNDNIREAVKTCKELGIKTRLLNMIGLPVNNPLRDAMETLEFNMELAPDDSWVAIFQPMRNTELWKYCIEKGLIQEDQEARNFPDDTILSISDAAKINRLARWWHYIVEYKMPMDRVFKLLEIPLTHEQKNHMEELRLKRSAKILYGII